MTATGFAARRLHKLYGEARASGELGGSSVLYRLAREGWNAFDELNGERRLIAFVLAGVFENLARAVEDQPVGAAEAARLWSLLDQPLTEAIDLLIARRSATDAGGVLARLMEAFARVRPGR